MSLSSHLVFGSQRAIEEAAYDGCDMKVGIENVAPGELAHTVFVSLGPTYFYHGEAVMVAETRPFVRVKPSIPMRYSSGNWDYGWAIVRSDGRVETLFYNPYTLKDHRASERHAIRWFAKKKQ